MPKLFPTWSRHSAETEELLRSSVDLIHYDCYTNGINKGKIAILKRRIFILFIWLTLSSFSSSYMKSLLWVCMPVCTCARANSSVSVPPPRNGYKVISIFQAWCTMSSDCNILHGLKTTTWALKFDSLLFSIDWQLCCIHQLALIKPPPTSFNTASLHFK